MSLKQTIVLGYPNSGKSKFLKTLGNQIFSPIEKRTKKLNYFFVKKSFEKTREETISALSKFLKNRPVPCLDEPFYYLLPFEENIFKKILKKDYIVATHRTAYFLISLPSIILINKKGQPIDLKISALEKIIQKPSFKFFEKDLINYSKFLNRFNDIHLSRDTINKIKNHKDFKKTRTTYLVRDFLIWFAFHPGDFYKKANEYKTLVQQFFKNNCGNIPKNYQRVINKCLGSFAFSK
ncbi:MAG: hypothetical protein WC468_01350 [Candidatus Paceibacterota bacterium]